jgi:hypothetical protein
LKEQKKISQAKNYILCDSKNSRKNVFTTHCLHSYHQHHHKKKVNACKKTKNLSKKSLNYHGVHCKKIVISWLI